MSVNKDGTFYRSALEFFKVSQVIGLILVLPTLIFYAIAREWPGMLDVFYHSIICILLFQASWNSFQTTCVLKRKRFPRSAKICHTEIPKASFIISAYLPNEVDVIEQTILNILDHVDRPKQGIEVIVAYNTPRLEELELKLRALAEKYPELMLANAYYSKSKSANLNYAIDHASGGIVVLIDADHLVQKDCLTRAWRWIEKGYDVVQGRCKIRNGDESLVAGLVEVEFEIIYGLMHAAKSMIFDTSLFGGSNGYWRTDVLQKIRFDENRLTEDIDSTLRALLAGYRFVHDRSIISLELAPVTLSRLWIQRKRWAQGWLQCAIRHQVPVWRSKNFTFSQKFLWTLLLGWREIYDILASWLLPVLFAFWLYGGAIFFPVNGFIIFAFIFTMLSGPYDTLVAYKNAVRPRSSFFKYGYYAFFVWPYTVFKTVVHLVAVRDEIAGERTWVISPR